MIARALRKIEAALNEAVAEAAKHGEPIDADIITREARRVGAQAEMVELGIEGDAA